MHFTVFYLALLCFQFNREQHTTAAPTRKHNECDQAYSTSNLIVIILNEIVFTEYPHLAHQMQLGKDFVRQNSIYKCVISDDDTSLDSADVFEVRGWFCLVNSVLLLRCVFRGCGEGEAQTFTEISMCTWFAFLSSTIAFANDQKKILGSGYTCAFLPTLMLSLSVPLPVGF